MPKSPELKKKYQVFKTQSITRAFKLVFGGAVGILALLGVLAMVTKTKHSYLMFIKFSIDCIFWLLILCLSRRWKKAVEYLSGITLINHFVIHSFYMYLAENGKFDLQRIDVLLTHELTFFMYITYSLLLSPSLLWSIFFFGPIYVIGSTFYDYSDFGYRDTFV